MAASAESLISRILNGDMELQYDFVVLDSEAFSNAQYDRPTVCVDPTPQRKLSQEGSYYRCKIYSGNSLEARLIDQATYDNIEAQILIAQFYRPKSSFLAPKQNLQPIDRDNVESLTGYINKLSEKIEAISHPLILERLRLVRTEAQQLRRELLLSHYKERASGFSEQFGSASSSSSSSSENAVVKKLFSSKEPQKFKPLDPDTFHAILDCLVEMSQDRHAVKESEVKSFDALLDDIKFKLNESVQRQLLSEGDKDYFIVMNYFRIIVERMFSAADELTQRVLLTVIEEINNNFLDNASVNSLMDEGSKFQGVLIGYITFLDTYDYPSERIKENLHIIRERAHEVLTRIERRSILAANSQIEAQTHPLHYLVEQGSLTDIKGYVSNLRKRGNIVDLDEKNFRGESIQDLAIRRGDRDILNVLSISASEKTKSKKGKSRRHPKIAPAFSAAPQEEVLTIKGRIDFLIPIFQEQYKEDVNIEGLMKKLQAIKKLINKIEDYGFDREELDYFIKHLDGNLKRLLRNPDFAGLNDLYRNIFCDYIGVLVKRSKEKLAQELEQVEFRRLDGLKTIEGNRLALEDIQREIEHRQREITQIVRLLAEIPREEAEAIEAAKKQSLLNISETVRLQRLSIFQAAEIRYLHESGRLQDIPVQEILGSYEGLTLMLAREKEQWRSVIADEIIACEKEIAGYEEEIGDIDRKFSMEDNEDIQKAKLQLFIDEFHHICNETEWGKLFLRAEFDSVQAIIKDCEGFLFPERQINVVAARNLILKLTTVLKELLDNKSIVISAKDRKKLFQYRDLIQRFYDSQLSMHSDGRARDAFADLLRGFHNLRAAKGDTLFSNPNFKPVLDVIQECEALMRQPQQPNFDLALQAGKRHVIQEIERFLHAAEATLSAEQRQFLEEYRTKLNRELTDDRINLRARIDLERRRLEALRHCSTLLDDANSSIESSAREELSNLDFILEKTKREYQDRCFKLITDKEERVALIAGLSENMPWYQDNTDAIRQKGRDLEREKEELLQKQQRLERIALAPFQLFLVQDLQQANPNMFSEISGKSIVLDNNNQAFFLIDGQPIQDKNGNVKRFSIFAHVRGDIPVLEDVSSWSHIQLCDDYEAACGVIEAIAQQGDDTLLYDVDDERRIKQIAAESRLAREKIELARQETEARFVRISRQVDEYNSFQQELITRGKEQEERERAEEIRRQRKQEKQLRKQEEQLRHQKEQDRKLQTYKTTATTMRSAKREAIQSSEEKSRAIKEGRVIETFGDLTLEGAAKETERKRTLTSQEELVKERARLESRLKELKERYEISANYFHHNIAVPIHRGDGFKRIRVRDALLTEIDLLLGKLDEREEMSQRRLQGRLNHALSSLEDDRILFTQDFMCEIDELTEAVFAFIHSSQLNEVEIVEHMMARLLPILFQGERENNITSKLRAADVESEKVLADLRHAERDIETIEAELRAINEKLQSLQSAEQAAAERAAEIRQAEIEREKAAKEEEIPRLERRILSLKENIVRQEKVVIKRTELLREAQQRRKDRFIGRIKVILGKIETSHAEMKRIPGKERLVVHELKRMLQVLETMEIYPAESADNYLKKLRSIKENIVEQKKVLEDCRGGIFSLFIKQADEDLFKYFIQCIDTFPEKNELVGSGHTVQNLYSFETLEEAGNEYNGAVQVRRHLEQQLRDAEAELNAVMAIQQKPTQRVRRNLPGPVGTLFSFFSPSEKSGSSSLPKGPSPSPKKD